MVSISGSVATGRTIASVSGSGAGWLGIAVGVGSGATAAGVARTGVYNGFRIWSDLGDDRRRPPAPAVPAAG